MQSFVSRYIYINPHCSYISANPLISRTRFFWYPHFGSTQIFLPLLECGPPWACRISVANHLPARCIFLLQSFLRCLDWLCWWLLSACSWQVAATTIPTRCLPCATCILLWIRLNRRGWPDEDGPWCLHRFCGIQVWCPDRFLRTLKTVSTVRITL